MDYESIDLLEDHRHNVSFAYFRHPPRIWSNIDDGNANRNHIFTANIAMTMITRMKYLSSNLR